MNEEKEQNLYGEEARSAAEEGDEINEAEEGFMKGYDEDSNPTECTNCHIILEDQFIEENINGENYRFCSEECAKKYEIKRDKL